MNRGGLIQPEFNELNICHLTSKSEAKVLTFNRNFNRSRTFPRNVKNPKYDSNFKDDLFSLSASLKSSSGVSFYSKCPQSGRWFRGHFFSVRTAEG